MKSEFKDELLFLANNFLFKNVPKKGESLEQLKKLIADNVTDELEQNLINNLLNSKYRVQISNFCTSEGHYSDQLVLSIFSMIFSILSFQEQ